MQSPSPVDDYIRHAVVEAHCTTNRAPGVGLEEGEVAASESAMKR